MERRKEQRKIKKEDRRKRAEGKKRKTMK